MQRVSSISSCTRQRDQARGHKETGLRKGLPEQTEALAEDRVSGGISTRGDSPERGSVGECLVLRK